MRDKELILSAANVLKSRATTDGRLIGEVGASLLTDKGNLYSRVCIDTGSGTGFCAENSAIAAMVTFGEYRDHLHSEAGVADGRSPREHGSLEMA